MSAIANRMAAVGHSDYMYEANTELVDLSFVGG